MVGKVWLRFITEPGLESAVIRWASWSAWSHVDLVLRDGRFLGSRLDGGVQIRPHDYCVPSAFRYSYVEVGDPRKVYGWATSQIGKKYDYMAILGFGIRHNWRNPRRWFCSEFAAFSFEQAHHPIIDSEVSRVTPQMCFESIRVIKVHGVPNLFGKGLAY